jgi:hypothetical protein
LFKIINKKSFNVVICETELDAYVFTKDIKCLKILDLAAPLADELYFGGKLFGFMYRKLKNIEVRVYRKSDYLTFHICNYGCNLEPIAKKAKYSYPPKIVFLGNLDGPWNNLALLSELSKLYPIDVYGGPKPSEKYHLNYKGYAPSTDIVSKYQFGLITITKDKLRKSSFSSKHLKYMSYGLPVFTPDWRKDKRLKKVSISYNEKNFLNRVSKYSDKTRWQRMSNMCYKQAKEWQWNLTLKPLLEIIDSYSMKTNKAKQ